MTMAALQQSWPRNRPPSVQLNEAFECAPVYDAIVSPKSRLTNVGPQNYTSGEVSNCEHGLSKILAAAVAQEVPAVVKFCQEAAEDGEQVTTAVCIMACTADHTEHIVVTAAAAAAATSLSGSVHHHSLQSSCTLQAVADETGATSTSSSLSNDCDRGEQQLVRRHSSFVLVHSCTDAESLHSYDIYADAEQHVVPTEPCSTSNGSASPTSTTLCATHEVFQSLAVDRRGDVPASNMTTIELEQLVDGTVYYTFATGCGITAVPAEQQQASAQRARRFTKPACVPHGLQYQVLYGDWDARPRGVDGSNILGGSGVLSVATDAAKITVPVMTATEELLSYYGAHLLQNGDVFRFQTRSAFPIFTMEIGEHYVPEYIIKKGMGLYLEHHNEPHYHEPMDSAAGGVYLLAKKVTLPGNCDAPLYHLTAFKVPFGTAVYSEPGAIHDDATTQGNWRVGYTKAEVYSTVILRNRHHDLIDITLTEETDCSSNCSASSGA